MKTKYILCMLCVTAYAVTTLLICASCENPWMREILEPKTITFESNGGSHVSSQDLIKGKKVKRPTNPSRIGFVFEAWYIDNETFAERWDFDVVPTYGFTLYANWIPETGTEGLSYALIDGGYSVTKGTVTGGTVYIPAWHRGADENSPYLPVTAIGENAFSGSGLTSVTIPAGVTTIGGYAFYYCTGLTSVTIPAGVTTIKDSTFYGSGLTSVIIPAGVTTIEDSTFSLCENLTSVTFAEGSLLQTIGKYAFYQCKSLTGIEIPASVTTIKDYAFLECTGLTSVTFAGTIASGSFGNQASFPGDLRAKFYATDSVNGTPGTYTTTAPVSASSVWTKR